MQEIFDNIFAEYYAMFRGQATAVPAFGDPEYAIGIQLANNSIRKWSRADGTLWRELIDTLQRADDGGKIVSGATLECPINMRKPPAKVRFYQGTQYQDWTVIDPQDEQQLSDLSGYVYFIGGANQGYTMYIGGQGPTQFSGWSVDYVYIKSPSLLTVTRDPGRIVLEMSDVNFCIQDMLSSRFQNTRNGFGYKTAKADAKTALADMKIENNSGTYNSVNDIFKGTTWGNPNGSISGIRL